MGAVLLVPVLAHAIREYGPRARIALAAVVLACSLWSWSLVVQGHTNFVRWGELLAAQAETVRGIAPAIAVALIASCVAYRVSRGRDATGRSLAAGAALLVALVLDQLALRAALVVAGTAEGTWTLAFRLFLAGLAPVVALIDLPPGGLRDGPVRAGLRFAFAAAVLAVYLAAGGLFVRLAVRTERVVDGGGVPGQGQVATFQYPEVEECSREYRRVPGFEDKKRALRGFLRRNEPR